MAKHITRKSTPEAKRLTRTLKEARRYALANAEKDPLKSLALDLGVPYTPAQSA